MAQTFICKSRNDSSALVKITVPLDEQPLAETDKAFGLTVNAQKIWLPKSQISEVIITAETFSGWLPKWLLKEKSLEYFTDTSHEPNLFD